MTPAEIKQLQDKIAALEAANAELAKQAEAVNNKQITMKVSEKGAISLTGVNARFPVTLYSEQWARVAKACLGLTPEQFAKTPMGVFIEANKARLSTKSNPVSNAAPLTDAEFVVLSKREDLTPAEQARINTYIASKVKK